MSAGDFDVATCGYRLFPLVAREQLTVRLPSLELVRHAPTGHADLHQRSARWFRVATSSTRSGESTSPGT